MGQVGDFISQMLVRWSWAGLLRASRCLVRLMQRRQEVHRHFLLDPCEWQWTQATVVEWAPDRECLLHDCFAGAVERGETEQQENEELATLMRACFLLTLLYDGRVQAFVMAHHDVHTQLGSRPPTRNKANLYMDAVRPLVDAAVERRISLQTLVAVAVQQWQDNFEYHNL